MYCFRVRKQDGFKNLRSKAEGGATGSIYIHMYIHIHTYIYIHVFVCKYIYVYIYICIVSLCGNKADSKNRAVKPTEAQQVIFTWVLE